MKKEYSVLNRNYVLYLIGQMVSSTGTWMQNIAMGWLVLKITDSPFWVGAVTATPYIVCTVFVTLGGTLADKFKKKKILFATQLFAMAQALALGFLTFYNLISLPIICGLAFLLGLINSVDNPTRHSLLPEIVAKNKLTEAISLNGAIIKIAQVAGPSIAGILIGLIGMGSLFLINGFSYLGLIGTLLFIKFQETARIKSENPIDLLKAGIKYVLAETDIRRCLVLASMLTSVGLAYRAILPSMAKEMFSAGPRVLGYLASAAAGGMIISSALVFKKAGKFSYHHFVIGGTAIAGIFYILLSFSGNYTIGIPLIFLAGFGHMAAFVRTRAELQIIVADNMRGRINGFFTMFSFGGISLGSFVAGTLANQFGCAVAVFISGMVFLLIAGYSALFLRKKY